MKQKFEEKLKKDFPQRKDGQKTTLELIPELGQFVEPFFPKRPPPGAAPPPGAGGPPPGPATHPPPANDANWIVPSIGCNTSDNTVFYLQIGPAAVKKGNQGEYYHFLDTLYLTIITLIYILFLRIGTIWPSLVCQWRCCSGPLPGQRTEIHFHCGGWTGH